MGRILLTMMFAASCAFSAELTWQPNTDEDLQGYLVYYGKESGEYSRSIDVGNVTEYTIDDLDEGETYFFIITAYDRWGNESEAAPEVSYRCGCTDVHATDGTVGPAEFTLAQNYPNPFNPETTIEFQIPDGGHVSLIVYNLRGQEVIRLVDEVKEAGYHKTIWNGRDKSNRSVSTGIYLIYLDVNEHRSTKKILFIK